MKTKPKLHPREDGSWMSRKLHLAVFAMLLLAGIATLTLKYPMLDAVYSSFTTGILGLYALYAGANGAVKHIYSKTPPEPTTEPTKLPEPPAQ